MLTIGAGETAVPAVARRVDVPEQQVADEDLRANVDAALAEQRGENQPPRGRAVVGTPELRVVADEMESEFHLYKHPVEVVGQDLARFGYPVHTVAGRSAGAATSRMPPCGRGSSERAEGLPTSRRSWQQNGRITAQ